MITLTTQERDTAKNPDAVRAEGLMPAVYYGKKEPATPIAINKAEFLRAWRDAGESTVVSLQNTADGDTIDTLIHDVQLDPVSDMPIHADFYVFERGKPIEVNVELEFVGESPAVKELGGMLVKVIHELAISALPKDLPNHIDVDVSSLVDFESHIVAGDITLPEGVALAIEPDEVVALVNEPREEEPEEPAEERSLDDIEVEGKGKEEEAEGEGADDDGEKKEDAGKDQKEE
ncbi:MAG: 50S ribosomal protein L25 [Candidatus Paceibacterota bacterium]